MKKFQIVSTEYHLALSVARCHSWNLVMGNQSLTVNACWNIKWAWQTNQLIMDDTMGKIFILTSRAHMSVSSRPVKRNVSETLDHIMAVCVCIKYQEVHLNIWSDLYNMAQPRSDNLHSTLSSACRSVMTFSAFWTTGPFTCLHNQIDDSYSCLR